MGRASASGKVDMETKKKLGDMLLEAGLIDNLQLHAALGRQKQWGGRLGSIIIEMGFVKEADIVSLLAKQCNVPCVTLSAIGEVSLPLLQLIPKDTAKKYSIFPVKLDKGILHLAMIDPTDLGIADEIKFLANCPIQPVLALESDIKKAIKRYYEGEVPLEREFKPDAKAWSAQAWSEQFETMLDPEKMKEPLPRQGVPVPQEIRYQALLALLVEKGLISEEEIAEKVRRLMEQGGESDVAGLS